jgi:hypothetical protein
LGTGWGGVLRWCLEFASRGYSSLEEDPMLPGFDLFILHLDADVAESNYENASPEIAVTARQRDWPRLPCPFACPPPAGSADAVRDRLLAWAGLQESGSKTVLCVPSKAIDAWLASAVLDHRHKLLNGLERNLNLEAQLGVLPKAERLKKTQRDYRAHQTKITNAWAIVRQRCTQAERFSIDVSVAIGRTTL